MLDAKDSVIARATKVLHLLSSDPEIVRLAELREKAIWDEVSRINGAKAEGKQEGKLEGLQEVARRMLSKGNSIEDAAEIAGLPVEEVRSGTRSQTEEV